MTTPPLRSCVLLLGAALLVSLSGCGLGSGVVPPPSGTSPTPTSSTKPSSAPKAQLAWHSHHTNPYLPGDVLIADSGNNRILLVTPGKRIVWQFPKAGQPSPLYDNDDVFFGPHFDEIITNQENNQLISIINFNQEKVVWSYGHAGAPGTAPGYLHTPDDAFLYDHAGNQVITVADIYNQRILFISRATHQIIQQYGQTRVYSNHPPTTYAAPNGDFPAPNGGTLITSIGGNDAILVNRQGQVVWTVHFPSYLSFPSDANFTAHGNIIVAFYTNPGAILKISPQGKILWLYRPLSGSGRLNTPSLAVQLPNGLVMANDDSNDRVIIIDPKTNQIVWQYGHTGVPGTAPGYLNDPDGIDLLPIGVTPGANNPIGHHLWSYPGNGY
ncbi:MAG: NHL repeat-containing protein [Sulfobacillus sp.]